MGRIADSTVTLAVPDPDGKRIGSGAATLNAIRALAFHYNQIPAVGLAHQVLQKVVTLYLQRDNLLVSSIKRLAVLAKTGREALMNCNIDELGDIMMETWRLHQELDPHCINEFVDSLFAFADRYCCGYKLVGAGGGGFALLLAKNVENDQQLRQALEENNEFDVKVYKWNV
nr:bifunctional fucokinase/fucose pyrophosphorylase [Tanacetum cinerariifolium]